MTLALFGIQNDGLNLVVNLLVFFLFVIWLALVYWTSSDASRRLDDPMLVACATAASLFPFIGTIVYTIVRPPEYLEDVHERELEVKAAEARLHLLENRTCGNCGHEIESTFLRCPSCMRKLREPCRSGGKPLDPRWKVCPFCEAEVIDRTPAKSARSEGRRRSAAGDRAAERAAERPADSTQASRPGSIERPARSTGGPAVLDSPAAEPAPSSTARRGSDGEAPADRRRTR
jgi:hypothetical protein